MTTRPEMDKNCLILLEKSKVWIYPVSQKVLKWTEHKKRKGIKKWTFKFLENRSALILGQPSGTLKKDELNISLLT